MVHPKKGDKMANQANQKEKILRIKDMLERETDEEHPLTAGQMIKKLSEFNITAERKSIYRDVDAYKAHIQTPHFKKFRATTDHMVKSRNLIDTVPISLAAKAK
jgi:hypothetical protein